MTDCSILPVNHENLSDLLGLIESFVAEVIPEKGSRKVRQDYARYFMSNGTSNQLLSFLLYKNDKAIGCIQVFYHKHPPMLDCDEYLEGEIMNLYVTKNERNKGYGKHLLEHLFKEAHKLGIQCLRLNSSPEAERLYERNGFKTPPFKVYMLWNILIPANT